MEMVFAYFDGDNIGSRLELLLLDDLPTEARAFSEAISRAIWAAKARLEELPTVEVLIAGGDDILAVWGSGSVSLDEVEVVREQFRAVCGQPLSVGIGLSASGAVQSLRRAKLMGKGCIVATPGVFDVA